MRFLVLPLLLLVHCTCSGNPSTHDAERGREAPRDAWALAVTTDPAAFSAPPGCVLDGEPWRAMVREGTTLRAASGEPGALFVVPPTDGAPRAARMTMALGAAPAESWSIPRHASVLAVGHPWALAGVDPERRMVWWQRSAEAPAQPVTRGEALELVSASCDGDRCALLVRSLDGAGGLAAFLGRANEPTERWRRLEVASAPSGRAVAMLAAIGPEHVDVALDADDAVEWRRVSRDASTTVARVPSDHAPVAASLGARPHALSIGSSGPSDTSDPGLRLHGASGRAALFRSPTPPEHPSLVAFDRSVLVLWTATEARDRSGSRLHGGLAIDAVAAGPVAVLAEADDYAVAARGDRVDLWTRSGSFVTYARLRCGERTQEETVHP